MLRALLPALAASSLALAAAFASGPLAWLCWVMLPGTWFWALAPLVARAEGQPEPGARLPRWSAVFLYALVAAGAIGVPLEWSLDAIARGRPIGAVGIVLLLVGSLLLPRRIAFLPALAWLTPWYARDPWRGLQQQLWRGGDPGRWFWTLGLPSNAAIVALVAVPWVLQHPRLDWVHPWPSLAYGLLLAPALILLLLDRSLALLAEAERNVGEDRAAADAEPPAVADAATLDVSEQLRAAVRRCDLRAVEFWLEAGADPNYVPPPDRRDLRPPLVIAAAVGHVPILKRLIAAGAAVHDGTGASAALIAATRDSYSGRLDAVRLLLANGADPRLPDPQGDTALHHAASTRDPAVSQALLDAGADPNAQDGQGQSPLARALLAGNGSVAELLLARGADPNRGRLPALHAAVLATRDDPTGVRLLLARELDVEQRDAEGRSALMRAAEVDHGDVAEALLAAGADPSASDGEGRTALHHAAAHGALRVLRRLLVWKADPEQTDRQGRSALHHAVSGHDARVECVDLLLALGARADRRDAEGRTPLDLALAAGRIGIARRLLLDAELPPEIEEALGDADAPEVDRAALLVQACAQGRRAVAQTLLKLGPLPQTDLVAALVALGDELDRPTLESFLAAGLKLDADTEARPLLAVVEGPRPALGAVERLLAAGADPGPDRYGRTLAQALLRLEPLPLALLERAIAVIPSARLDAVAPDLLAAILERGSHAVLLAALERGVDPNAAVPGDWPPLARVVLWHADAAAVPLVRTLLRAGAQPELRAPDGASARGLALARGALATAELLDWPPGSHPGQPLGAEMVARAARQGALGAIRQFLRLGLPVDASDEHGASALVHACGRGDLALVGFLLDHGADPRQRTGDGISPLGAAVRAGQGDVVRLLLAAGVAVDEPIHDDLPALSLAAARADPDLLQVLLDAGADPNAPGASTPPLLAAVHAALHGADEERALICVRHCLRAGADPNAQDPEGRTALSVLVGGGRSRPPWPDDERLARWLNLLIERGAALTAVDALGRSALHWACRHGLLQAALLLYEHGADPRQPDDLRKLPLDLAPARVRYELAQAFKRQPG